MLNKSKLKLKKSALSGVKTKEGKQISKFNALKHGILMESVTSYEKGFYTNIIDDLQNEYNPQGITEQILIERIAINYLKLFRLQRAETEYMKSKLDPRVVEEIGILKLDSKVVHKGYKPKITSEEIEKLSSIYSRYETTIENRLIRSLHELERIQRARKGEKIIQPVVVDINQVS